MEFINTELEYKYDMLFRERAIHSEGKLSSLKSLIQKRREIIDFDSITIFTAGSYARREASKYSDIDLFFISSKKREYYNNEYNVPIIRMMSSIVKIGDDLEFPKFSNDGQFLKIMHLDEMLCHLGGSSDDYENHFTTRLLLLLESECLFSEETYNGIMESVISSYFRDYPQHESNFRPNFLINDVLRFWKTLCLNYEHKRNQPVSDEHKKIKQKIKNFKLKYSRMMTCYATVAYLCSKDTPITENDIYDMVKLTPSNRFRSIGELCGISNSEINNVLERYHWFLQVTDVSEEDLIEHFRDESRRTEAFRSANEFGDSVYRVMQKIDERRNVFRYLVI